MVEIRRAGPEDIAAVTALSLMLWPDSCYEEREKEFVELLNDRECAVFICSEGGIDTGFAQVQLRHDYVEGTNSSPVGYLEGVFVRKESRGKGAAGKLLESCENWAAGTGCREFASDCELSNENSIRFHLRNGFRETNRIVCFTKELGRGN